MNTIIILSVGEAFCFLFGCYVVMAMRMVRNESGKGIVGNVLVFTSLAFGIAGFIAVMIVKFPYVEVLNQAELSLVLWTVANLVLCITSIYAVWYLKVIGEDRRRRRARA